MGALCCKKGNKKIVPDDGSAENSKEKNINVPVAVNNSGKIIMLIPIFP